MILVSHQLGGLCLLPCSSIAHEVVNLECQGFELPLEAEVEKKVREMDLNLVCLVETRVREEKTRDYEFHFTWMEIMLFCLSTWPR